MYSLYNSNANRAVSVTVVLGAHDVSAASNDQHQISYTLNQLSSDVVITYPGWYVGKVEDDVLLIQLPERVALSRKLFAHLIFPFPFKTMRDCIIMLFLSVNDDF